VEGVKTWVKAGRKVPVRFRRQGSTLTTETTMANNNQQDPKKQQQGQKPGNQSPNPSNPNNPKK
jgi:hypothetical protein